MTSTILFLSQDFLCFIYYKCEYCALGCSSKGVKGNTLMIKICLLTGFMCIKQTHHQVKVNKNQAHGKGNNILNEVWKQRSRNLQVVNLVFVILINPGVCVLYNNMCINYEFQSNHLITSVTCQRT